MKRRVAKEEFILAVRRDLDDSGTHFLWDDLCPIRNALKQAILMAPQALARRVSLVVKGPLMSIADVVLTLILRGNETPVSHAEALSSEIPDHESSQLFAA